MTTGARAGDDAAPELSWILPLFRTSAHLDELLDRVASTAVRMGVSYEIVLVDDACPDGSGERAEQVARQRPQVRVIRLARNHGQDGALRAGLRACHGQWAVLLDADLQDPPEAVIELWSSRTPETDAVFANRTGFYTTAGRHLTSRLYRSLAAAVAGLPEGASLFVLLNRPLIDRIGSTRRAPISVLAAIASTAGTLASVPITRASRPSGRSAYSSRQRLAKGLRSLWQMFLSRRLRASL